MKYIGNKTRIIPFIEDCLQKEGINYTQANIIDLFAGTGSVSLFFKKNNCNIKTCDFMTYSIAEQYRTLNFNKEPYFEELKQEINNDGSLINVLNYLNNLEGKADYFYNNFAPDGKFNRQYFSNDNAKKIDAIREKIETWKHLLSYEKYMLLIGILMHSADFVSNTAGTYGAYLKIWRSMAKKNILLTPPEFVDSGSVKIFQDDVNNFVENQDFVDIVYLDPPYNARQYASYFHLLENIVVYDKQYVDNKTGTRDYSNQKSKYCLKKEVYSTLDNLIKKIKSKYIVFSYSNEGLLTEDQIIEILKQKGPVKVYKNPYRRFKTNSWTSDSTGLCEILFICKCK